MLASRAGTKGEGAKNPKNEKLKLGCTSHSGNLSRRNLLWLRGFKEGWSFFWLWVFKEWWGFFVLRGFCEPWSCFWVQGRLWRWGRWSIGVGNRCWG